MQYDYSVGEVARMHGLKRAEVEQAVAAGELRATKHGGLVTVNVWQAAEWWWQRQGARDRPRK